MTNISEINFNIEVYASEHIGLVEGFNSGACAFNDFLKMDALVDKMSGKGVTYIVTNNIEKLGKTVKEVVAYYTISTFAIQIMDDYDFEDECIPKEEKRIHYNPMSSFLINMFAVDKNYQDTTYNGELISSLILMKIVNDLYNMSINLVGAKRIILCSVKEAVEFYQKNNFKKFDKDMTVLDKYLDDTVPMQLILHKED